MLLEGVTFTVCWLYIGDDYPPVAVYLAELYKSDSKCYAALVEAMKRLSDPARHAEPHVRPLKGKPYKGIFELKAQIGRRGIAARIPLIQRQRNVILLFGDSKTSRKSTPQFLKKAIQHRDMIDNKEAQYEPIDFEAITPQ